MANPAREFDKTHLSIDTAEERGFIHRDYVAHCLRWSHISREARRGEYKKHRWLDIGCGKDQPLARLLHTNKMAPVEGYYVGLDLNKLEVHSSFENSKWKPEVYGEVDATRTIVDKAAGVITVFLEEGTRQVAIPTHVVCLEVLEHMHPRHCLSLVKLYAELADAGATIYTSTPCYDAQVGAADNHINELTYDALGALFEDHGLAIKAHYGTFASQKDYKHYLSEAELEVFNKLKEYYDSNLVSNIMAPLHPALSRNCIWVLEAQGKGYERKFQTLSEISEPWTSSPEYRQLLDE